MPKARKGKSKGTQKKVKPVLHIYCEGKKTEPLYIEAYLADKHPDNRLMKVVKVEDCKKNTPVQIVEWAIADISNNPPNDVYWAVYDREGLNKYSDELHKEASDKAKNQNINIALSNICFEYWLLLHMTHSTASYSCCDDLLDNSDFKSELKKRGINDYEKGYNGIYEKLSTGDGLENAKRLAKRINHSTLQSAPAGKDKPYQLNPYTDVYKLLNAIDKFIEEDQETKQQTTEPVESDEKVH